MQLSCVGQPASIPPELEPELLPLLEPELDPELLPLLEPELLPELEPPLLEPELDPELLPLLEPELDPELLPLLEPELEPEPDPELLAEPELLPLLEPELDADPLPPLDPPPDADPPVQTWMVVSTPSGAAWPQVPCEQPCEPSHSGTQRPPMHARWEPHVATPCTASHESPALPLPADTHEYASGAVTQHVCPSPHWNGSLLQSWSGPHARARATPPAASRPASTGAGFMATPGVAPARRGSRTCGRSRPGSFSRDGGFRPQSHAEGGAATSMAWRGARITDG